MSVSRYLDVCQTREFRGAPNQEKSGHPLYGDTIVRLIHEN